VIWVDEVGDRGSAQMMVEGRWDEFSSAILSSGVLESTYISGVMGDALRREIVLKRGSLASIRRYVPG
jgi:hypothetical protein